MTEIPTQAPRSEDGQWWWDGSQWQPVSGQAPGADAIPNVTASATAGQTTSTYGGATVIVVGVTVKNEGQTGVAAGRLNIAVMATASDRATESSAHLDGNLGYELEPGDDRLIELPLQVDPGSWTVWVDISDTQSDNALVTRSPEVTVRVEGEETTRRAFDDARAYALTVRITHVEHIEGELLRVHYDLQNDSDRELPAGMTVHGNVSGPISSDQLYQLTVPLPARHAHSNYLTMEAHRPSHVTATISVDPGGPSQTVDSVEVEIAADGTPTISR